MINKLSTPAARPGRLSLTAIAAAIAGLGVGLPAAAQTGDPLRTTVETALQSNPEISARFNAYRASESAVDAARSNLLPKLDLNASIGRGRTSYDNRTPEGQTQTSSGVGLTLRQLLWDGLGTASEVRQSGHERLGRYFELLDLTEQTALDAARAHYDVLRYRRLVQLAEDNFVQHRYAALQIDSRVRAGVGRGVDSEQVGARQALAESNLTTEVANLHDVIARYQRIVGEQPPAQLPTPALMQANMPSSEADAVATAIQRNTAISASIEGMRAARAAVSVREAAFQPRVEARLRGGAGRNYETLPDQTRNARAEIVMNWNLFNGGGDRARVRQQVALVSQAGDLRDKACRDARQVASIAYNDTRRLTEQLVQLDRNTAAIVKTRDAYRQQFETGVGQRTLLDLLNSENEVYTAQRAQANAQHDLGLAYVRTQASVNKLVSTLGLAGPGAATGPEIDTWSPGEDAPRRCPILVPEVASTPRPALDTRADQMVRTNAPPASTSPVLGPIEPAGRGSSRPGSLPPAGPATGPGSSPRVPSTSQVRPGAMGNPSTTPSQGMVPRASGSVGSTAPSPLPRMTPSTPTTR